LHRILALKDLGFPLDRIARVIDEGVTADALLGMLTLREMEQEAHVQEETERLARLRSRLRLVESGGMMASEVVLKDLSPQWIVSIREVIPGFRTIGALFGKLHAALGPLGGASLDGGQRIPASGTGARAVSPRFAARQPRRRIKRHRNPGSSRKSISA
jgi:DNA-binding transcriptional MerR regulator